MKQRHKETEKKTNQKNGNRERKLNKETQTEKEKEPENGNREMETER